MECPYCDKEFIDHDDWNIHIIKNHPDKTTLEDFKEARVSRMWQHASELTIGFYGNRIKHVRTKEEMLETWKYFLRELMKSE